MGPYITSAQCMAAHTVLCCAGLHPLVNKGSCATTTRSMCAADSPSQTRAMGYGMSGQPVRHALYTLELDMYTPGWTPGLQSRDRVNCEL